jgi:hypothetical protein
MTPAAASRWHRWVEAHRGATIDAVWDGADPWPSLFDVAGRVRDWVRHPRSFVRKTLLNQ